MSEKEVNNMKQYKAVAGPKSIQVDRGNPQQAFNTFANIINQEANNGWEYHSMEAITVTTAAGCFQPPTATNYYMLIFVRDV